MEHQKKEEVVTQKPQSKSVAEAHRDLNPMCLNCMKLDTECAGKKNPVWTGCIYKVSATGN